MQAYRQWIGPMLWVSYNDRNVFLKPVRFSEQHKTGLFVFAQGNWGFTNRNNMTIARSRVIFVHFTNVDGQQFAGAESFIDT